METWARVRVKRARTAETPKLPSPVLRLRAPRFYPTTTNFQQGLAATCKDLLYKSDLSQQEDLGGADEPIGAKTKG